MKIKCIALFSIILWEKQSFFVFVCSSIDNDYCIYYSYFTIWVSDQENEIVTEGSAVVHGEPCQDGSVPPNVDTEVQVLDEKVSKQIIKEGHGSKPSKYSTCFCKYPLLSLSGLLIFYCTYSSLCG